MELEGHAAGRSDPLQHRERVPAINPLLTGRLILEPDFRDPTPCPSVKDRPRFVLAKDDNGSDRANRLVAVNISVLTGWLTPDHRRIGTWVAAVKGGESPSSLNLVGHHQFGILPGFRVGQNERECGLPSP
jgi:hypothetical protein